jgi:hypothetical protein
VVALPPGQQVPGRVHLRLDVDPLPRGEVDDDSVASWPAAAAPHGIGEHPTADGERAHAVDRQEAHT